MDYSTMPRHRMLCIDFKSFFASCEAIALGLDPLTAYIVVVGDLHRSGSIVLAASPMMKKEYGIKTGSRLYDVPTHDSRIKVVQARMSRYLHISTQATKLLNRFVPMEAIHVYSIDESWVCLDGTERLYGDVHSAARRIQQSILTQTGLPTAIGIGDNKLMSKVCLDCLAKKSPEGIGFCTYEDYPSKIWDFPIEDMWGIGFRMKRNLNGMGIRKIGHIANFPLEQLKHRFGKIGEEIYWHSHGIDWSDCISHASVEVQKGYGHGIQLLRDYNGEEIKTVILELCEEVAKRTRRAKKAGRTVSLGIGYSAKELGGGFSRSRTMYQPTNITMELYKVCLALFKENYNGSIIRSVHVSITNLVSDEEVQMTLFDNHIKERELGYVMDRIREKYGSTAILRARSYTEGGLTIKRSTKIGGHHA